MGFLLARDSIRFILVLELGNCLLCVMSDVL